MIELRTDIFDPWQELANYQSRLEAGKFGACTSFVGSMRDFNEGDDVSQMTLEHYPGMTEKFLQKICDEASAKWPLLDCLIIHRVGEINPNESIVLTAAWSAHRDAAFAACRYLIEELKHRAPFWKKEQTSNGERWVETNTPAS
jgi:molybdopterin synthase catalytic subunit